MDFEKIKNQPIILYGFGVIGKVILKNLLYLNCDLKGVAVTSLIGNESTEGFDDIRVDVIENWSDFSDSVIIISTSEKYHKEMSLKCESLGFKNVVFLTPELKKEIIFESYRVWLEKCGVDLSKEIINIHGANFINPFKCDVPNSAGLLGQIGNFVVPIVLGDFEVAEEGPYEYGKVMLEKDDIVLDLGANLGTFSVYATSKGCKSYAFEPTNYLVDVIKRHNEMNGNSISVIDLAVSDKSGETEFYTDINTCGGNTLLSDRINSSEKILVKTISVDEFVISNNLEKVDFIKADIEGAERWMLEGAQETIKKFAPKLALCTYHLPDDKEVLTNLILKANPNYKISYKYNKLFAYVE